MRNVYIFLSFGLAAIAPSTCFCQFVRQWGEPCFFSSQCADHRMICTFHTSGEKRCLCNRFHAYTGANFGCVQKYNASFIIEMVKRNDTKIITPEKLEQEAEFIFRTVLAAGILVLIVGVLCSLATLLFCYYNHKEGLRMKEKLKEQDQPKPSTSSATS